MFFPERIRSILPSHRVLEVGPGGTPHSRSDVFLDRRFEDPAIAKGQRGHTPPMVSNKPLIYYDGDTFPFKDKEFDYVICSHVLEHVPDPEMFISEITRVGKSGYLEFPTIYYDYIYDFPEHVVCLLERKGCISWMPKADSGIPGFRCVTELFYRSLEKEAADLIDYLKLYLFQGFEWSGSIACRRVHTLEELTFRRDEISLPPYHPPASSWSPVAIFRGLKRRLFSKSILR